MEGVAEKQRALQGANIDFRIFIYRPLWIFGNGLTMDQVLIKILQKNKRLELQNVSYLIYKAHLNRNDYSTLNYIEKKIMINFGDDFLIASENKIALIMEMLLDDDLNTLYEFYKDSFDFYMKHKTHSDTADQFNLLFITFIHLALKTIKVNTIAN